MHSLLSTTILAASLLHLSYAQTDYSQYVNPLIGTEGPQPGYAFGSGDVFVGGAVPFGVAKVGIDTWEDNGANATLNGGYTPKGRVTAITMMHESGTGGPPKYGIIPQMPLTTIAAPVNLLDNTTYWQQRQGNDTAQVGYFKTTLENGVTVEVSGARHSGIMQYTYPAGAEKHILVDVSHYLPQVTGSNAEQYYVGGSISLHSDGKSYSGYGTYIGGFGEGVPFTVYFYGEFDATPDTAQTFHGRNTDPNGRYQTYANEPYQQPIFSANSTSTVDSGPLIDRVGALFSWNNSNSTVITSRVGISSISTDKACQYKDGEISTFKLQDVVNATVAEWNRDVFSKIQVDTGPAENQTNLVLLYSSLYFIHLMPSDRTGENPLWQSSEPFWDDFYTLWDIFRCTVTLYQIIQPTYYEGMIRSLIDIWRYQGYMPDGRSGNDNGLTQGGSNADNVLADAYVRGLRGAVNWTAGYQAMLKDAEVLPFNTFSLTDPSGSVKEGRGALNDWLQLGYVSQDRNSRCISRSVEYSLNDFSLYQLAQDIAPNDTQKYLNRSAYWQNTWSHDFTFENFTGFLAPKLSDGQFNLTGYNPAQCGNCEWTAISYEGTPFEYGFTVPHDMETLIAFCGGPQTFEQRLDYIFQPNTSQQNLGANGPDIDTIMNIGNEPDFATPYEYNYINKQAKSVQRSRALANQFFHDSTNGIPGNSDAGALNTWLVWQMLGLYPVATQPIFLIESPWFNDINITVNGNATLRITATGLDNSNAYYVQSVRVNGQPHNQNWLNHADVMVNGGSIEYNLGSNMTLWETGPVPPSPGHLVL